MVIIISDEIKKRKISVTLNPGVYLKTVNDYEIYECSSASDLVNTALIEFFTRRDLKREQEEV